MAQTSSAGNVGYRSDMDGPAHESTYDAFTHFTTVGTLFVACVLVGLALGGVKHSWPSALVMIFLAHITTAIGLFSKKLAWRPNAAVLALMLLMMLFY